MVLIAGGALSRAFGMGMIITTFMIGISSGSGSSYVKAAIIGNAGAVIGSVVSTRLMLRRTSRVYGKEADAYSGEEFLSLPMDRRSVREGSLGTRFIEAMLSGGKNGVEMGIAIIPGVLIICSFVMLLTNGPGPEGTYTGGANEGIALLPWMAQKLDFLLQPLFGFSSPEAVAVPITALGAAGAAIGLIPGMVRDQLVTGNDIAVFTAMCMCWSGYLSTHVAMMDTLKFREMTGSAILYHTVGGLCAGVSAHWMYLLL